MYMCKLTRYHSLQTYESFVALLGRFNGEAVDGVLEDVRRDTQESSLLRDYFGADPCAIVNESIRTKSRSNTTRTKTKTKNKRGSRPSSAVTRDEATSIHSLTAARKTTSQRGQRYK